MRDEIKTDLGGQYLNIENLNSKNSSLILHPSSLKILLWDIDGTLTISPNGGAYKDYFAPALERAFGSCGKLWEPLNASGKTDLQIAFEVLEHTGASAESVKEKAADFCAALGEEIERFCANVDERFIALPGVREILQATNEHPKFINALLTGNLSTAARFKLDYVGLSDFFDFAVGAFGEESHRREDLPAIAARTISKKYDYGFSAQQFIVIGDTPNDIACARHFGMKAVAVATGRNHPPETLLPHNPDYLFENLENTAEVLRVLETL